MRNFSFVVWMIFYPLACKLGNYTEFLMNASKTEFLMNASKGQKFSVDTEFKAAFINFCIWVFIGYLVYEDKDDVLSEKLTTPEKSEADKNVNAKTSTVNDGL